MALSSMTGFGCGKATRSGMVVEIELSTVNRRHFDVRLNMPRALTALESQVYGEIHRVLHRGTVTGVVRLTLSRQAREERVSVDMDAARAAVRGLRAAARKLNLSDDLGAGILTGISGVLCVPETTADAMQAWPVVRTALRKALRQLNRMRKAEGESLAIDLAQRLDVLRRHAARIKAASPKVIARYRAALARRLKEAGVHAPGSDPQLSREIVLFADRCDISEEIVRLESHFGQAAKLLSSSKPVGRALDFLCQELFREINTISSKANDAGISAQAIAFKTVLETVREQVQNVE